MKSVTRVHEDILPVILNLHLIRVVYKTYHLQLVTRVIYICKICFPSKINKYA